MIFSLPVDTSLKHGGGGRRGWGRGLISGLTYKSSTPFMSLNWTSNISFVIDKGNNLADKIRYEATIPYLS